MNIQLDSNEKRFYLSLAILFLFFYFFRILSKNYFLVDSYEYIEIAKYISNQMFFDSSINPSLLTKRPFFYPLFLSFLLKFKIEIIILIQTFFAFSNSFILVQILKKFNVQIKPYHVLFFLLTPSIFIYSQLIMSEWLLMLLINLKFWLFTQKWSNRNFFFIQILTILLAFTKPVFYPFIYLNFVYFFIFFFKKKVFSFFIFLPIILLQLYLHHNETRTGYKHFSSIENKNLINYNLFYFKSFTNSPKEAQIWLDSIYNGEYEKMNFQKQNEYLKQIGISTIKDDFFRYTFYHVVNAFRGVLDPGRFDLMTFFKKEDGNQGFLEILNGKKRFSSLFENNFFVLYLLLIPVFLFAILKVFLFSYALIFNRYSFYLNYIIMLFFYCILITGPINCSRFMMPLQGIIFVFYIVGINSYYKKKNINASQN